MQSDQFLIISRDNLPDLARLLAPLIKESMNQVLAEPIESYQNLEPTTQNV